MSYADRLRTTNLQAGRDADAQIAALTERLRAVEAERDTARKAHAETMSWLVETGIALGWKLGGDLTKLYEVASALRAELERKDAALKEARELAAAAEQEDSTFDMLGRPDESADAMDNFNKAYDRKQAALAAYRAALQPKEPPCQTA